MYSANLRALAAHNRTQCHFGNARQQYYQADSRVTAEEEEVPTQPLTESDEDEPPWQQPEPSMDINSASSKPRIQFDPLVPFSHFGLKLDQIEWESFLVGDENASYSLSELRKEELALCEGHTAFNRAFKTEWTRRHT